MQVLILGVAYAFLAFNKYYFQQLEISKEAHQKLFLCCRDFFLYIKAQQNNGDQISRDNKHRRHQAHNYVEEKLLYPLGSC